MSDIAEHAGKTGLRYFEWLCEESIAMRRFSKSRVARNRRRAHKAEARAEAQSYEPGLAAYDDWAESAYDVDEDVCSCAIARGASSEALRD